ncbi:hypothetical protein [Streptomyces sp. NPDC006134]|uniref:hypothetical protein n=1 Tax=Streptomyces sp. NPDC006134 TaxID=3154467 RepID=UPI00340C49DE
MTGGEAPADRAGTEAEMGDERSDGGATAPRRARPGRAPGSITVPEGRTGPSGPGGDAPGSVEALLSAALRADGDGAEGERRAVAAFRAARDAGAHRAARTRRRDDWRPRARRRTGRSLKATLSVLLAGLALGGAAYAAIGGGPAADGARGDRSRPPAATPPAATPPGVFAGPGSRAADEDGAADCRAYERVKDRGEARDAAAWRRLLAAAGGEQRVAAYCARQEAGQEAGREVQEDDRQGGMQDGRQGGRQDDPPTGRPVEGNGPGGAGRGGTGGASGTGDAGPTGGTNGTNDTNGASGTSGTTGTSGTAAVGGPGRPGTSADTDESGGAGGSGAPGDGTANADEDAAGSGQKPDRNNGR